MLPRLGEGRGRQGRRRSKAAQAPQRVIEILSRDEVQRIEDRADSERDKLIVRLLADTGVRVGELVKVRQRDLVDRDRNLFLLVRSKGDRERLVPLSPALARRLRRYADRSRPSDTNSDRVLISRRRTLSGAYEAITESRDLGEQAGPLSGTYALSCWPSYQQARSVARF